MQRPSALPSTSRRPEDEALITGRGTFTADLVTADTLHAWFVRSPFPCGEISEIDCSPARSAPGVVAVFTANDLTLADQPVPPVGGTTVNGMDRPMLARSRVTHVGEPLAVVIADHPSRAEEAAGMVLADIELAEPVLSVEDALSGQAKVHPDAESNVAFHERIIAGPAPPEVDLVEVSVAVEHPRLAPSPIEPLAIVARPGGGGIHLHVGVQSPHQVQREVAATVGLDASVVRVTVPEVGGAFGMKRFYPEYAIVAAAALYLDREVAWVQTRRDLFLAGTQGRGQHHRVILRADAEGRIHEARIKLITDVGAYPHRGIQIGLFSRLVSTGLYAIPRVDFELTSVVTNLPPTAPYRGAGRPEAALAIERAITALAHRIDLDPAELRRRNLINRLPHVTATGARHDSGDYQAALDRALDLIDYDGARLEQAERRSRGSRPLGVGIGAFVERAGGAPDSWEYGSVAIADDGAVVVRTGSTSAGQGQATVWRRLAAEVFDAELESVVLVSGDTAAVPDSVGSFASRSAQVGASAVWRCAETVRRAAASVAADLLEADPTDIVTARSGFHVAGVPDSHVTLAEIAAAANERAITLDAEERYSPGAQTFPYGVHVAVVEVDVDTGRVVPVRLVAVDDVGVVLDANAVTGQVHGSVMQGLGAALSERMQFDEFGQPLTTTFMDYLIPSFALDVPLIVDHLSHPAPSNPLGVKGAGEGGCIGMPPAILNATLDALAPYGVTELQIPLTPNRVWEALRGASPSQTA